MSKVLVIGASGQLGSVVLDQLLASGQQCVAFIRKSSSFIAPESENVRVIHGDLADADSVLKACVGIKKVIATASAIVPRRGDSFGAAEVQNYRHLITACQKNNVEQLVYISAFSSPYDNRVPEFGIKRQIEQMIVASGIPFTIFRSAPFMDIYYAVMGSRLVLDGVTRPTLSRGFWLTSLYGKLTKGLLETYGVALLPGMGRVKQSFICVEDVATFMVKALSVPTSKNRSIELGGPKALSWRDVVDIYAEVLGKPVTAIPVPCFMLNAVRAVLRIGSPAGENLIGTMSLLGRFDFPIPMDEVSQEFKVQMTDTRQFLLKKLNVGKKKKRKLDSDDFTEIPQQGGVAQRELVGRSD